MKKKVGKLHLNRETLRNLEDQVLANVVGGEPSVVATNCGTCAAACPTGVNGTCSCDNASCKVPCGGGGTVPLTE
jgi:hypothetical protein